METTDIPDSFLINGVLPDCFNEDKLPRLNINDIDFWDETHKKARVVGKIKTVKGGKQMELLFRRNPEGKLDPNGEYASRGSELNMKYDKEARFCMGCAIAMDKNGDPELDEKGNLIGEVLPIFDYSKTTIVSNHDCWKAFRDVIQAAKNAPDNSDWVTTDRADNAVCEEDPLIKIRNEKGTIMLSPAHRQKLEAAPYNLKTVGQFKEHFANKPSRWKYFVDNTDKLSYEKFVKTVNIAKECKEGAPVIIDYRKAANPHAARYGAANMEQKVLGTAQMKALTNVHDLVTHIVQTGINRRVGTKHADDWHFYHDALSMMTSNETMEWMERKGWLKCWILPKHGLNAHLKHYKAYRPIGNNMRAMPWDFVLNKDHDDIALRHVAATCLLPDDDPRKFSLATPDACASTYLRVYNAGGIPSHRIVQDILKAKQYWQEAFDNQGRNVNVNAPGHRGNEGQAMKNSNWGGNRTKKTKQNLRNLWCHPDAQSAMEEFFTSSEKKFNTKYEELTEQHTDISDVDDRCFDPEQCERDEGAPVKMADNLDEDDGINSEDECE